MDDEVAEESRKYGTQTGVDGNEVIQRIYEQKNGPAQVLFLLFFFN